MKPGKKKKNSAAQQEIFNPTPIVRGEPIEFKEEPDWPLPLDQISLNGKYSGIQKTVRRKTRLKQKITREFMPNDTLDLHGKTRDQAISRVHRLVRVAHQKSYQSILIITGKGVNSKERGGVLGRAVWEWLQSYRKDQPIRFQWAPSFLGGKGAIIVFF